MIAIHVLTQDQQVQCLMVDDMLLRQSSDYNELFMLTHNSLLATGEVLFAASITQHLFWSLISQHNIVSSMLSADHGNDFGTHIYIPISWAPNCCIVCHVHRRRKSAMHMPQLLPRTLLWR